jgi:hypothetical protein
MKNATENHVNILQSFAGFLVKGVLRSLTKPREINEFKIGFAGILGIINKKNG